MNIKAFFGILVLLAFGNPILMMRTACARPVDLSAPTNGVGAANFHGQLEIWSEVGEIDFGNNLKLPLRFKFTSEKGVRGVLGEGFWCPLIESSAFLIRPAMMRVKLPCGKNLYLRREKDKFQTLDKQWMGIIRGEDIVISRDDGWELRYTNGRLTTLTTDTGRKLKWSFNGSMVTAIHEGTRVALKIEASSKEISFIANLSRYRVSFGKRPLVNVALGQRVIEGFVETLNSWGWPDGRTELVGLPRSRAIRSTGCIPHNNPPLVPQKDRTQGGPVIGSRS